MSSRPNFLHIGPSKAGSTWIFKILSWHPDIYAYPGKNLGFFSTRYENGVDWYLDQFQPEPQHQAVGEVSHSYLVSPEAPKRIRDLLPDVKLTVCLREPVERTFSDYLDGIKNGKVEGSLEDAIEQRPSLVNKSRYGEQIERYLQVFDRNQIHIASFDELKSAPDRFAAKLFEFLEVKPLEIPDEFKGKVLPAGTPRVRGIAMGAKRVSRVARKLGLRSLRGKLKTSPSVRNMLYRPYNDDSKPVMPIEAEERLRRLMIPEVQLLDSVAGTDFCRLWNYPPGDK